MDPPVHVPVDLHGNFQCLQLELIQADHLADGLPQIHMPVDLNGNFGCLLLELIWADHLADVPPG